MSYNLIKVILKKLFLKKILIQFLKLRILFIFKISTSKILKDFISFKDAEIRFFENIHNLKLINPEQFNYIENSLIPLFYSNPIFDLKDIKSNKIIKSIDFIKYTAIFYKVEIIGGSNLILLNNKKVLYDLKFIDKQKKYKFIDEGIKFYRDNICLIEAKKTNINFKKAIYLGGNFSWNYYHYIYEILIKFEQIDSLELDSEIPFLLDKECEKFSQFMELFNLLNKGKRKIIFIDKGKRYFINELYYSSCPNIIPPEFINNKKIQPKDVLYDLKSLTYIRDNLLKYALKKKFPKRIYLSRKKAINRRKFNEDEIIKILEKYKFITVFPENYSIIDQITLFNNAEFIIGGTGAAFSNLLFCNNSCKIICLTNYKIMISIFSTIASSFGFDLLYVYDENKVNANKINIHNSYKINPKKIEKIIKEWL